MQVTERQAPGRLAVRRIDAPDRAGCVIEGADGFWAVVSPRDGRPADTQVALTVAGAKLGRYLVTGLAPGKWRAQRERSQDVRDLEVSEALRAA